MTSDLQGTQPWLLCDFHIHTRPWSDGEELLEKVVDLYGQSGFDAICITDHVVDSEYRRSCPNLSIAPADFGGYLEHLWQERRRAWELYRMLLIPGSEITNQTKGYHILAVDIKTYIDPDLEVETIIKEIHRQGGIAIACHPHRKDSDGAGASDNSRHLWNNHARFSDMFDAWEVANRDDLFNVVGLKKYRYIANGDFHCRRHLYSWKTLLRCEKNVEAIKQAIRDNINVSLYLYRERSHP
ncbi:MAG: phosphotransferase [Deltaproteobacteria bacterium]|jgi:predicted metal-dependent phosphoesterase TrpH|nr:phosphotransferase [Deltaproteobacteria bacterium]